MTQLHRKYPVLEQMIVQRRIRKKDIAEALHITARGLSYKLTGIRKFTWDEVCQLHKVFFSDLDKDKLMSEN